MNAYISVHWLCSICALLSAWASLIIQTSLFYSTTHTASNSRTLTKKCKWKMTCLVPGLSCLSRVDLPTKKPGARRLAIQAPDHDIGSPLRKPRGRASLKGLGLAESPSARTLTQTLPCVNIKNRSLPRNHQQAHTLGN